VTSEVPKGREPGVDELVYDPYSEETAYDPHALFRRLRDEAPLYYSEEHDFYALSRFDDVERAHVDRETFISRRGATLSLLKANVEFPPGTVIFEDPPVHTIHRSLLSRMFTTRRVAGLDEKIRELCADQLDPLVGTGRFDFASDLGAVMPTRVVSMLIGIPDEASAEVRDFFDAAGRRDLRRLRGLAGREPVRRRHLPAPAGGVRGRGRGHAPPHP
jgi:cytochrome P450